MTTDASQHDFAQRMQRIEALVQRVEQSPPGPMRDAVQDLVRLLLELHRTALAAMVHSLEEAGNDSRAMLDAWARQPALASVLLLHDLHPWDLPRRVREADAQLQPALRAQQSTLEILSVSESAIHARLTQAKTGGCGCGSGTSGGDLSALVEDALRDAAPEVETIQVETVAAPVEPALVQLGLPSHSETTETQRHGEGKR